MSHRFRNWTVTLLALALAAAYQFAPAMVNPADSAFDVSKFGELPAAYMGRVQPIDSVARNSLLMISGRQSVTAGEARFDAVNWLLTLVARPEQAAKLEVFRIDHPGVRAVLELAHTDAKRFSFDQIMTRRNELQRQVQLTIQTPDDQLNLFQRKTLELNKQLALYQSLGAMLGIGIVPRDDASENWLPLHAADAGNLSSSQQELASAYQGALQAYSAMDAAVFNRLVARLSELTHIEAPAAASKAKHEARFNRMEVFPRTIVLYLVAMLLALGSWLVWREPLAHTASTVLVFALVMHTLGIAARIYISGRPPVTNLYSSAVFVGWGTVLLCHVTERFFRSDMGVFVGALTGFLTLMIAQGLSGDGDTMAVLQAVLDTNFWLATHVVVITLGYAATYLAGCFGAAFVLRGIFTRTLSSEQAKRMAQMIYGVVCFATLFSFVGTILGGIWADQSWGRFWGWDPKENGAMIIVLWNALVLHARWGGLVRYRGLAIMAIFGNVVTSWSWFGVNMLGRGLHSYGFMESAAFWLVAFVGSQVLLIAIGLLPLAIWRSTPAAR